MEIKCLSKYFFDDLITNDLIQREKDFTALISILDPDNEEKNYSPSPNFLQIKMWDIVKQITDKKGNIYPVVSDETLMEIINFIERNKDKKQFIIHCSAGISRSGAVGRFIHELFEPENKSFYENNQWIRPNLYILNRLHELYNGIQNRKSSEV